MLMADDRSEHMGFDGSTFVDDDGLTWDLNFFWEIMAEDNKSDPPEQQNSPEDLSYWERFWGPDAFLPSSLGSGDLKPEAVFQFMCPQGNSNPQYGEHSTFLGNSDINYQQFCGSMPNSFQTLVPQDLLDTSMIDMIMPVPWELDGNCNIKKDGVTGIQDEMTDFQIQFSRINGLITPDVHVGESGQSVVPLSGTPSFSGRTDLGRGARVRHSKEMMVCEQCGDAGFENAYVYCVNCSNFVIHRYCLPSLPATFDELVNWLCVDCESELRSRAGAKGAGKAPE